MSFSRPSSSAAGNERYNFAYAGDEGRVYKVWALDAQHGTR